jgi:hypothetical protein
VCLLCGDDRFTEVHNPASQAYSRHRCEGDYQFAWLDSHAEGLEYLWKEALVEKPGGLLVAVHFVSFQNGYDCVGFVKSECKKYITYCRLISTDFIRFL